MKWNFLYQITAASRTPEYGATAPRAPFSLFSVLNWICWTLPPTKFLGTPLVLHHLLPHPTQIQLWQYKSRVKICSCTALIALLCFSTSPSNIRHFAWIQASAAKYLWIAFIWATLQRAVVIPYRRFGTTNRSYLNGSRIHLGPCKKDRFIAPKLP